MLREELEEALRHEPHRKPATDGCAPEEAAAERGRPRLAAVRSVSDPAPAGEAPLVDVLDWEALVALGAATAAQPHPNLDRWREKLRQRGLERWKEKLRAKRAQDEERESWGRIERLKRGASQPNLWQRPKSPDAAARSFDKYHIKDPKQGFSAWAQRHLAMIEEAHIR
ncbi:uncharacterized protein LOC119107339 [Pollicipes pollicipes]|uniref:uncharacterized protein LOC119107339 n=1 Tax=Pollicipes pollicipes TaxID=41117 RepID=UPI00188593BB|nr:uncharacterized protein LOC119107339 [Pollicipes pollicipes]